MPKKALVVDDEEEMRDLLRFTLEKAGLTVDLCDNGRTAWELLQRERPDILILDVMLPGIDGFSLQTKLSQEPGLQKLPVLVLTALLASEPLFAKFPNATFMTKPFSTDELVSKVQQLLQSVAAGPS